MTYATDRLQEEIAYIAYHFHWNLDDILDLEHHDRREYADRIGSLVSRATAER